MSEDANQAQARMSAALGQKLKAVYELLQGHGLSTAGFVERAGVLPSDVLGTWSALAAELLRLSEVLRSSGEATDADLVRATAKQLKGETAMNWRARALVAVFVGDTRSAVRHAIRCLEAADWDPDYEAPSVSVWIQMANVLTEARVERLLGVQKAARVNRLLSWEWTARPLPPAYQELASRRLLDLAAVRNGTTMRLMCGAFVDSLVFVARRLQSAEVPDARPVLPEDANSDHGATRRAYAAELLDAGHGILAEHLDCAYQAARSWAAMALENTDHLLAASRKVAWALNLLERFERREADVYTTDEGAMMSLVPEYLNELHELAARLRKAG